MGNIGPRGIILEVQVGGGTNMSAYAGIAIPRGVIPEAEVGGGTNMLHCTIYSVIAVVVMLCGCCHHCLYTIYGVIAAVIAPHRLQLPSLCYVWC